MSYGEMFIKKTSRSVCSSEIVVSHWVDSFQDFEFEGSQRLFLNEKHNYYYSYQYHLYFLLYWDILPFSLNYVIASIGNLHW